MFGTADYGAFGHHRVVPGRLPGLAGLEDSDGQTRGCAREHRPRQYFQQALGITLLNPKAIVFYMAFFSLFVDPTRPQQGLITFGAMAVTIAALTFLYGLGITLLTYHLTERLRASPRIASGLEKLAGVFLIGFGLKLALSK